MWYEINENCRVFAYKYFQRNMCFVGMRMSMSQKPRLVNKLGELRENQAQADYGELGELFHPDITGYLILLLRIN